MACSPQSWDWLENRRGEDDEVPRRVWKTVETKAGKSEMAKTKRRREKGRKWNEIKGERIEEKEKKKRLKKKRTTEVKKIVKE